VRYLALHDNQYLRYFKGHTDAVMQLEMCPVDDTFVSGAADKTVRFWDLRDPNPMGILECKTIPCIGYDPEGLILAIVSADNHLKLFDRRKYVKGPFSTFSVDPGRQGQWTHLKWTPDGEEIVLRSSSGIIRFHNSYGKGERKNSLQTRASPSFEPAISPDGGMLLCGSKSGMHAWDLQKMEMVKTWQEPPPYALRWNPQHLMFASAGGDSTLKLWLPPE